jgi:nitroimidazol reductase NimA-like FMN-containing flavoprotein (pyridoxamine 5'-phosphate oxidase superfamily)
VESKAIELLDRRRIMAIATNRLDGWPQCTTVGYANDGLLIYFLISRFGQKFANIARDNRVSIAIAADFEDPGDLRGLSIAAFADEVKDEGQRRDAYDRLRSRRPSLEQFPPPDFHKAALMRARCNIITVSDYSQGFGHADVVTVDADTIVNMTAARPDDWGLTPRDGIG